jgi:hypothetical protein
MNTNETAMTDVSDEDLLGVEGGVIPTWGYITLIGMAFCFGVGVGNAINEAMGVDPAIHC